MPDTQTLSRAGGAYMPSELAQRTLHRRAVEAINWGIPAVDTDLMLQAAIKAGGGPNQMTY